MKLNTETYSSNEKVQEINYNQKDNMIDIFIFDEDDQNAPYKRIAINSNNELYMSEKNVDGEIENEVFTSNFGILDQFNIDSFLMKDMINNNNAVLELDQENLRYENAPKKIDKFQFLKKDNQVLVQTSGHPKYEDVQWMDVVQIYKVNSDNTCDYQKGDSFSITEQMDLHQDNVYKYFDMYGINREKIRDIVSEVDDSLMHSIKMKANNIRNKFS